GRVAGRSVLGLYVLRARRGWRELRYLQYPVADRSLPQAGPALPLSGVLDRAEPQDVLQDPVPANAGPHRRTLAGRHAAEEARHESLVGEKSARSEGERKSAMPLHAPRDYD